MSDYLPINPNIIKTGTKIGCDLFLHVKSRDENRFVLYCREDVVFEEVKRRTLKVEKHQKPLYKRR